jgi:hypothetical protein
MLPLTKLVKYIKSNERCVSRSESIKTSLIINQIYLGIQIIVDITDGEKSYTYYMPANDKSNEVLIYRDDHNVFEVKDRLYQYDCGYGIISIAEYFNMRCPYINEDDWKQI